MIPVEKNYTEHMFAEHQIVGGLVVPSASKYLGEVRISADENLAVFPCEMLNQVTVR
jgi:hypothetical protein